MALPGLFGSRSAPSYTPSEPYRRLQYDTVYPRLTDIINQGGLGLDTAGLERTSKENIGANFSGAMTRIRAGTMPYGNPGAGSRLATRVATAQAGEESRAIREIRTQNATQKNQSLLGTLGLASGVEDPALKAFYANMARFNTQSGQDAAGAQLLGDLAGLGFLAWNPGGVLSAPGTSGTYGIPRAAL